MEGVTLGMNYGLNRLRKLGVRPSQIRVTGGGANQGLATDHGRCVSSRSHHTESQ